MRIDLAEELDSRPYTVSRRHDLALVLAAHAACNLAESHLCG
jgi:hypothetical protein